MTSAVVVPRSTTASSGSVPSEKNRRCVRSASPCPSARGEEAIERRPRDRRAGRAGMPDAAVAVGRRSARTPSRDRSGSAPCCAGRRRGSRCARARARPRPPAPPASRPAPAARAPAPTRASRGLGRRRPRARARASNTVSPTSFSGAGSQPAKAAGQVEGGARWPWRARRPPSTSEPSAWPAPDPARARQPGPRRRVVEVVAAALGRRLGEHRPRHDPGQRRARRRPRRPVAARADPAPPAAPTSARPSRGGRAGVQRSGSNTPSGRARRARQHLVQRRRQHRPLGQPGVGGGRIVGVRRAPRRDQRHGQRWRSSCRVETSLALHGVSSGVPGCAGAARRRRRALGRAARASRDSTSLASRSSSSGSRALRDAAGERDHDAAIAPQEGQPEHVARLARAARRRRSRRPAWRPAARRAACGTAPRRRRSPSRQTRSATSKLSGLPARLEVAAVVELGRGQVGQPADLELARRTRSRRAARPRTAAASTSSGVARRRPAAAPARPRRTGRAALQLQRRGLQLPGRARSRTRRAAPQEHQVRGVAQSAGCHFSSRTRLPRWLKSRRRLAVGEAPIAAPADVALW